MSKWQLAVIRISTLVAIAIGLKTAPHLSPVSARILPALLVILIALYVNRKYRKSE
jgi:hypothetical protein